VLGQEVSLLPWALPSIESAYEVVAWAAFVTVLEWWDGLFVENNEGIMHTADELPSGTEMTEAPTRAPAFEPRGDRKSRTP